MSVASGAWGVAVKSVVYYLNPFPQTGRRALDVLAMPDPPVTRDVHKGGRHDASGVQAVECDRTALL